METKIPLRYVIELGRLRKLDLCASCGKIIQMRKYNIQLCEVCRLDILDKEIGGAK